MPKKNPNIPQKSSKLPEKNLAFMKKFSSFWMVLLAVQGFVSGQIPKIKVNRNHTFSYAEMLSAYQKIDAASPMMQLQKAGISDAGNVIYLMVVNKNQNFTPPTNIQNKNVVWLVMNGIHPGESEGIDASVHFLEALAANPKLIPDSVTLLIIPCYNVDGMINRKQFTRCGQNGPHEKGFRASANNYDLNRDFLKADAKNTFVFYNIFQDWQPEVFLDTHTSNGADYQYTMTLITTQKDKLGGPSARFMSDKMNPYLFEQMKKKGWEMAPYVNVFGKSPDDGGYEVFIESPKFSTGYTSLFGTLGFVAETHMLKPYGARVESTYALLDCFLQFCKNNRGALVQTKIDHENWQKQANVYASNYKVSRENPSQLNFKGYELELIPSKLGDYQRHYSKPYTKTIPYYDSCYATLFDTIPNYLIVPQNNHKVIERLQANRVSHMVAIPFDSVLVQATYINQVKFATQPYEGHFVHSVQGTQKKTQKIAVKPGDWIIPTQQLSRFYLMEVLSAETQDGFLAWNFFDPIFNEKEGFSDYVFEDEALQLLEGNPQMKQDFEAWKLANPEKAKNKYEVLGYLYKHSGYAEIEYQRFPIYRY